MSSQSEVEQERALYQEQLDLVDGQLNDDPDNEELKSLKAELLQMVALLDESLAEFKQKGRLKPTEAPAPMSGGFKIVAQSYTTPDASQHAHDEQITDQVNDTVTARWASGNRGWYPARITAITGSATAPMYTVKFKTYDTVETIRARDIRPFSSKRKADGSLVDDGFASSIASQSTMPAVVTSSSTFSPFPSALGGSSAAGTVVSAAASLYPEQVAKMKAQQEVLDGDKPRKAKKIKANKELEAGKSKWQEFSTKSKFAKSHKKDSMFRTPDGTHGRVGFIGSGKAMRKDAARTRHIYQQADED